MPRQLHRLNPRMVATLQTPGRHADGGNLYLYVGKSGKRSWVFMFRWHGRIREMGLGGLNAVTLAKAREKAASARALLADGISPMDARAHTKAVPTFGEMADSFIADLKSQWRNPKHIAQWQTTMLKDVPSLRSMPVDRIETGHVLHALKPIWSAKPETAGRIRGRIERVLDAAKAKGLRSGENPARWRGHLENLLPKRQKLTRGHHAALSFDKVPEFMGELRKRDAIAALALEFLILTAARSREVRGATWGEIDLETGVWTVPAWRMKAAREHRVPLSARALAILGQVQPLAGAKPDAVVFPSTKGTPLSDAAFSALLKRMQIGGAFTPHGFRSSFRDWAAEKTSFPREVAEQALAHIVGDATERAYRRGDALEKRRELMQGWGHWCEPGDSGKVIPLLRGR